VKDANDSTLLDDLIEADEKNLESAEWSSMRAAVAASLGAAPATLIEPLNRGAAVDPPDAVAGISLAEVYAALGDVDSVIRVATETLAALNRSETRTGDAAFYPPGNHILRTEWELAAKANTGNPAGETNAKRDVARWHLHSLLAIATGKLEHYINAVIARPDLPSGRAALGCALARQGRLADAVQHLQAAVTADPFDRQAARALFQVLTDLGHTQAARRFARARKTLAEAEPQLLPPEPWFADLPPVGDELASLIVLCCNEAEVTRLYMESVLKHTRKPYRRSKSKCLATLRRVNVQS
jgi:tetratricopeptide (TPR) repeat protein